MWSLKYDAKILNYKAYIYICINVQRPDYTVRRVWNENTTCFQNKTITLFVLIISKLLEQFMEMFGETVN